MLCGNIGKENGLMSHDCLATSVWVSLFIRLILTSHFMA